MNPIFSNLQENVPARIEYLRSVVREKENALKVAPSGRLHVWQGHGKMRYYRFLEESGKRVYLKQEDDALIRALAQKSYDESVLRQASKELRFLETMFRGMPTESAEDIYGKIPPDIRTHTVPITETDEVFAEKWQNLRYPRPGFRPGTPELYSDRGERMRSKSEILIANALNKYNIPYRYEFPVLVEPPASSKIKPFYAHPDFTILKMPIRRHMYWEHFGMMDHPDYANDNIPKMDAYQMSGIFPGDQMIMTFETKDCPLDMRLVDTIIQHYFLS